MTDEKILTLAGVAEIEERASKANHSVDGRRIWFDKRGHRYWIETDIGDGKHGDTWMTASFTNKDAAEFFLHSCADVPALCATVRAQAEEIERLKMELGAANVLCQDLLERLDKQDNEIDRLKARVAELEAVKPLVWVSTKGYLCVQVRDDSFHYLRPPDSATDGDPCLVIKYSEVDTDFVLRHSINRGLGAEINRKAPGEPLPGAG